MEIKALACEILTKCQLPFSSLSHADIAQQADNSGILASIRGPRFDDGSVQMQSNHGLTEAGYLPVTQILPKKLESSLIFTMEYGKANHWELMIK